MEILSVLGLALGVIFVVVGILLGGSLGSFFDLPSIMIVFGGTIAATMVGYNGEQLRALVKSFNIAFKTSYVDLNKSIADIISLANTARREGLLALEESTDAINEPFLKKGVMLIVDGTDPELVKNILETELSYIEERHQSSVSVVDSLAALAPAYGMIGTLIGLINMLQTLDDPSTLGPGMSVALVTTFYGSVLANMFFTPISNKLKSKSAVEILYKTILLEGILSIQAGENPRLIEEKLNSFIARQRPGANAKTGEEAELDG